MFSAKINRLEGSEREDLPRRERECGFDRRNNLDRPLSFQFSFSSLMGRPIISFFFFGGSPTCD